MKDSRIEWIGQIPKDWKTIKLKNIYSDSCAGEVIDKSYWNEGNELLYTCQKTPMLSSFNVFPIAKRTKKNDLLLTRNATPYIFIPKNNSIYSNVVQRITIPNNYDNRFVRYSLMCGVDSLTVQGDTIPSYNMQVWNNIIIPDIPLYFQQHIADFLDDKCGKIDRYIEKQQQIIEKLKAYKQSVITEAVTKGLDPNVPMKDSGIDWIGMIPEDWKICKIGYVTKKIGSGKTPKGGAEIYVQKGILFLRSQNIYNCGLEIEDPIYITEETDEEMNNTRVYKNDVLLNITGGSIGRSCIYPFEKHANVNQHVCIIRVINTVVLPQYMNYFWISNLGQTSINIYQTGANREGLNFEQISKTFLPIPSVEEQKKIVSFLEKRCNEIDSAINKKQSLIDKLNEYKKSLIYEAVTGKLEII